jgi:Kef-type K+ transport system membrane component KefB
MDETFYLTAAVLAVATVIGFIATRARQPLIVAFIAVGIIVGPSVLGWVDDTEQLELFAEIGVAVLLFLVGLKLDIRLVRTTGRVAVITGLGQVVFTSAVGFALALLLGMSATTAIYVAVALTFSSTIIIVKLLSDKRELDELHGRIALGFLIVQDIVVVLVMITLSSFGADRGDNLTTDIALVVLKGAAFLGSLAIAMRWVLPRFLVPIARSRELLIVAAVSWAVALAAVSDWLGFSTEVGAFLAGFALASTPFRESIASSLTGLRDFLLLFFFIELGAKLNFGEIGGQIPAAIVLSLFVLVGNPLIVLVIMGIMGYPKRVSFLSGLAVAQISEFSLILVALGLQLGHIGGETVGLVTLVGMVTIGLSTYLILYSNWFFDRLEPFLSVFERTPPTHTAEAHTPEPADVILYGTGRFGRHLTQRLIREGHHVLVVDWDPHATRLTDDGSRIMFGDAEDPEFPSVLPLGSARWVVSTIARADANRVLVDSLRHWGFEGRIAVTAHTEDDAALASTWNVDAVLQPFSDAAEHGVGVLFRGPDSHTGQQH